MKLKMKKVIACILIIVLIGFIGFSFTRKPLELNGDEIVTININETYKEEGTNKDKADIEGKVDTSKEGQYTLTYSYHNQEVKRIVKVVDPHRLVMNLNGSVDTYVKQNEPYIESGCHVIDKKEGNLTHKVKREGHVDTSKVGDYQITYTVTNSEQCTIKKQRTVHVLKEEDFVENTKGIPVLMYHYVYTKDDQPKKLNTNYILDTDFEAQLQYLVKEKYYFPSYQELKAYVEGKVSLPQKSVILTFDDGQKGFLKYGIPILEKYHVPATSFVIGIKEGEKKVKQYASEYISFQSHSYDMHHGGGNRGHGGIISAMNQKEILEDLKKNQILVQNSEAFAYPYGDVSEDGKKAVTSSQTLCAFTTQYGRVKKGMNLNELPRVRVLGQASLKSYISTIE